MKTMQIHSKVGLDGVLNLRVEMGVGEAASSVLVTIQPEIDQTLANAGQADWHQFIEETYGSCAGLGLERPPQGKLEERDVIE